MNKVEYKAILNETGVKNIFTQNAKMKRSSSKGIHLYNFGIPAFKSKSGTFTCPNASKCVVGCYARNGAYIWDNVSQAYEARLTLTKHKQFTDTVEFAIDALLKKHRDGILLLRIHDSGDFYNKLYQLDWYLVAHKYLDNPRVQFYAYTKMVEQTMNERIMQPKNFRVLFSYGGKQDSLIVPDKHYNSKVFPSLAALTESGYIDGTYDDTVAALGDNTRIGLVYHGTRKYDNTTWGKV